MTNFEFYKDEINDVTINRGRRFALVDDKILPCDLVACQDCKFTCTWAGCTVKKFEWLYQEHIEKPTLSKRERLFCELVETGYIARDEDGELRWYLVKPVKSMSAYEWMPDHSKYVVSANCPICGTPFMGDKNFPFIKWEDDEPWAVEDLLKLEVRE